jgi:predicted MFS family arabinose efflux permease
VTIENKLDLNTVEYGALGSIVYLGLTVGSVVAPMVFQWNKNKLVLTVIMSINGGLLVLFTLAKNYYYILFITRMCIGFCQVFVCIYMPVWIDTFGNEKQKSAWMTIYLLASPLGIVFGYAMTAIFVSLGENHDFFSWEWSFWT